MQIMLDFQAYPNRWLTLFIYAFLNFFWFFSIKNSFLGRFQNRFPFLDRKFLPTLPTCLASLSDFAKSSPNKGDVAGMFPSHSAAYSFLKTVLRGFSIEHSLKCLRVYCVYSQYWESSFGHHPLNIHES